MITHIPLRSLFLIPIVLELDPTMQHLTIFKKAEIVVLHEQNVSISEIARRLLINIGE